MLFSALLSQVLIAIAVSAVPTFEERHAQRVARRTTGGHVSYPLEAAAIPDAAMIEDQSEVTQTYYSAAWSGAVLYYSKGTSWQNVTGTFTVPTPQEPFNATGFHSASAWVGLDGYNCNNLLQTGVDFSVNGNKVTYTPWYEWYPASAKDFSGFPIHAGDTITATVIATSSTNGTATLFNHATGAQVTHTFSNQPALCNVSAEWIVEDYIENGKRVPLSDFGTITFTNISAERSSGPVDPSGARIYEIKQNGTQLTSVSVTSSAVVVNYVGP
ncbi:acid proteinase [Cubamyces sp. BRFM 1775]|nr:acid proteinase [Cubamyces sp. BRFM 1775]